MVCRPRSLRPARPTFEGTSGVQRERGGPKSCSEIGQGECWYRIPESRQTSGGFRLSTVLTVGYGQFRGLPAGLGVRMRVQRARPAWTEPGPEPNLSRAPGIQGVGTLGRRSGRANDWRQAAVGGTTSPESSLVVRRCLQTVTWRPAMRLCAWPQREPLALGPPDHARQCKEGGEHK